MINEMGAWLTPPKIAKQLGVDIEKVYTWIRSGELRAIDLVKKRGGRPRFRVSETELNDFIQRRSVVPPPAPAPRSRQKYTQKYYV
jgi:excisionase family DNA binding protein